MSRIRTIPVSARAFPEPANAGEAGGFSQNDDNWKVLSQTEVYSLDFSSIPGADSGVIKSIKAVLSWYVQNRAPIFSRNIFYYLKHFFAENLARTERSIDIITNHHLMGYRDSLGRDRQYYLSSLAGFLKKWHAFGHPGVDVSAIDYLRKVRLSGNRKGEAVLTMDPKSGPFTDLEFEAIHASLTEMFRTGVLSLEDYLATRIFMLLAARPIQVALLKVCDLLVADTPDGTKSYSLDVPRAKQRGVAPRGEFKRRPITSEIGALLAEHVQRTSAEFAARGVDPALAPIFAAPVRNSEAPADLEWHLSSAALSARVTRAFANIAPMSERTGEPIYITPTRFRRTLGTRAAAEGRGVLIIAEMLDHTDTQSVQVYVEARPDIIKRIDKAVAMQMAPLAQAFAGAIVQGDDKARPRITDPRFDPTKPVGSCGQHSHCAFSAPVACYTCGQFNAWVDGPHEAVLEHLLAEEERLVGILDERIATINRRTILAVAEVVRRCDERMRASHG